MTDIAIRVENLGKQYRIGTQRARYKTLRESLTSAFAAPFRHIKLNDHKTTDNTTTSSPIVSSQSSRSPDDWIWALKDVSFDVKQGEVVGVIGRNGAGKSTLLKILSRITAPTEGRVEVYGRVASLLEVGTGFHPELTGRENIYLNGAILGMHRAEIERKFDEMVAFAEAEKFIDTPVKHYSSGMYVRLAFAVAAHLEPEILLVDEVLAVGDASFQKKCLGKMGEVAKGGRTVLFVSHNMAAILNLCGRGMLLDGGQVQAAGPIQHVVDAYLSTSMKLEGEAILRDHRPDDDTELRFLAVRILGDDRRASAYVDLKQGCSVEIEYEVRKPITGAQIAFELWNSLGICVLSTTDLDLQPECLRTTRQPGLYRTSCFLESVHLRPGRYWIDLGSSVPGIRMLDEARNAISFEVVDTGSVEYKLTQGRRGVIAPILRWDTIQLVQGSQ